MREQVITHKVGNRSGIGSQKRSSAVGQRPTKREGGEALVARFRVIVGYVPAFLKVVLAVVMGLFIFAGYRAAASASFFQVRAVTVEGTSRVSAADIQSQVRKEVEKTGVWKADLKGLNARLERLPWVRTAVVSRVLPDGIRVRIVERLPRAVVRTASGRFRWVDDDAVLLGEMLPTDQMPSFFLRGLTEDDPDGARQENRERVAKFMELQRDWDAAGLSERVSEVNLIDIRDIRAQLAGDNSQIEVRLGAQDHGKRLKDALEVLDAQKQTSRGSQISYIDLSQGKRAIVGLSSGAHSSGTLEPSAGASESTRENTTQRDSISGVRGKLSAGASSNQVSKPEKDRNRTSAAARKKADDAKKNERRKR